MISLKDKNDVDDDNDMESPHQLQETQFIPTEQSLHQPDNFRTRRVYDSEIFKSGFFGGILGAVIFSLFGILLVNQAISFPGTERLASAGGFFVFSIAIAGTLISALIASLVALFHRG